MVAYAAALLFLGSVPGLFAAPPERSGRATFSKLVVIGDSLAAGVENGSLVDFQQEHGFAKVVARQMHVPLSLPLVPYPGRLIP
jgi:hypothetical protein